MTQNITHPKAWDIDRFKRPGKVTNGQCEHDMCDWCPHGCFDDHEKEIDEAAEELARHLLISKIEAKLAIIEALKK